MGFADGRTDTRGESEQNGHAPIAKRGIAVGTMILLTAPMLLALLLVTRGNGRRPRHRARRG